MIFWRKERNLACVTYMTFGSDWGGLGSLRGRSADWQEAASCCDFDSICRSLQTLECPPLCGMLEERV